MSTQNDKFAPFAVSTHAYKSVDGHPILLDIFIPKKLIEAGPGSDDWKIKRPVMLNFHAGWLVGGRRDFQPWWSQWILDLMVKDGAIVISADHRLIPEATAEDVLDDIHDAWKWMADELSSTVQKAYPGLRPDLSRVLLTGSSAGAYCALQLGLTFHKSVSDSTPEPRPRAVLALYPYVSLRIPYWSQAYEKDIFGTPQLPTSILDDHLASIAAIRVKTGKPPILTSIPMLTSEGQFNDRALLAVCAQQQGRILELFGPERDSTPGKRRMQPEDRIIDGRVLPPTAIVQGTDDTISPVEGADVFVEYLRTHKAVDGLAEGRRESDVLRYFRGPGEHLWETELGLKGKTEEWIREAVSFLEKHWLN